MGWRTSSCVEWRELTLTLTGNNVGDWPDYLDLDRRTHPLSSEYSTKHYPPRKELPEPNLVPVQSAKWRDAKLIQKRLLAMH